MRMLLGQPRWCSASGMIRNNNQLCMDPRSEIKNLTCNLLLNINDPKEGQKTGVKQPQRCCVSPSTPTAVKPRRVGLKTSQQHAAVTKLALTSDRGTATLKGNSDTRPASSHTGCTVYTGAQCAISGRFACLLYRSPAGVSLCLPENKSLLAKCKKKGRRAAASRHP
ncbi:unnamed protein product [Spodoptera exigua]|nr:unnamed protein product [Spodoptera exigua]